MSSQEFFARLCNLLCELNKLVKEYLFGKPGECKTDCEIKLGQCTDKQVRSNIGWD